MFYTYELFIFQLFDIFVHFINHHLTLLQMRIVMLILLEIFIRFIIKIRLKRITNNNLNL